MLTGDVCFRPPITIRFHNLHVGNIRGAMGVISSYHERDYLFPFFLVPMGYASFGLSLDFLFCLPCDGFSHRYFIGQKKVAIVLYHNLTML